MTKRLIHTAIATLMTLLTALTPTIALADPPKDGTNWVKTFDASFDDNKLPSTLTTGYAWGSGGESDGNPANGELQSYRKANVTFSGGAMNLTATKGANTLFGQNYQYASGMVTSANKFSQTGGYWEARIQFPKGNGLWGAFWTLGLPVGKWPYEIDVVEAITNDNDGDNLTDYRIVNINRHYPCNSPSTGCSNGIPVDVGVDLTTGYHLYGVNWDPGKSLTYYFDGKVIGKFTDNIPNEPQYLLSNLAVGGHWPGNPTSSTKFPAVMKVDHIRVWKSNGSTPVTPDPGPVGPEPCPACPVCPTVPTTVNMTCTGSVGVNGGSATFQCVPVK